MKNPFKGTIIAVPLTRAEPYWRLAKLDVPAMFLDLTKEQARYAAHAINQHETLMDLLRRCHASLRPKVMELREAKLMQELAALLAEVKP